MFQAGFLGTDASFITDLTLILEAIFFIAICVGVVAQRRGKYKLHDWIQTPVVVLNFFLILFVMVTSFVGQQIASTLPQRPTDPYYLVVALHAVLGLIAQGLAMYVLLAGHQILPRKIGRLRYWMWATFGFWTAAFVMGVATYYVWYMQSPAPVVTDNTAVLVAEGEGANDGEEGGLTSVFLQNFVFAPAEPIITVGTEMVWVNQDSAPHNVTFVDGSVASDNFFRDESFAFTFEEAGTYEIYCTLHGSPDGSGMATTVTVLDSTAENVAAVAAAPTANPIPPTPTPAPTVEPPPVALLEPTTPEQTVVGLLSFFDSSAPSDSVSLLLTGIAPPEGNNTFEAWLMASETDTLFSLGLVETDANGRVALQYSDPDGTNLLGLYDGFQLTLEPQFDDDPTPGTAVYSGQQVPLALDLIQAITVSAPDAPSAYGLGARQQAEELLRQAGFLQTAHELLSIADSQRYAEHIVNLLAGENGAQFGDLDGLNGVQNPGDGFGIVPYVTQMQSTAVQAAATDDATNAIQVHSTHVVLATDNALLWSAQIEEAALQILAASSVGDIGSQVETIVRFSDLLLNGEDSNSDGGIAPNEGGIFTAYQHSQYMGAIPVLNVVE